MELSLKRIKEQTLVLFFKNSLFITNLKIIALQYCIGLSHRASRISHRCTHVLSLSGLPPTPIPSHPPGLSQSTGFEPSDRKLPWLSNFTNSDECASVLSPSSSHRLLPLLCLPVCSPVSSLLPYRQVPQYHLSRSHTDALIHNMCLSLSEGLHSV